MKVFVTIVEIGFYEINCLFIVLRHIGEVFTPVETFLAVGEVSQHLDIREYMTFSAIAVRIPCGAKVYRYTGPC